MINRKKIFIKMTQKFTTVMRQAMSGDIAELFHMCPHLEIKVTPDQQIDQIEAKPNQHHLVRLRYHHIEHGKYQPEKILIAN